MSLQVRIFTPWKPTRKSFEKDPGSCFLSVNQILIDNGKKMLLPILADN